MARSKLLAIPLLLAIGLGSPPAEARACPGCKEAVDNQSSVDEGGLRDGYSWSILLMMSAPFVLLTTGTLALARASRRGLLPEF